MNMIVCTCDSCGKVTERWFTLNLNFDSMFGQKEICPDCLQSAKEKAQTFLNQFDAKEPKE